MKETINEHDMTKAMMSIMRGGYKKLLKEDNPQETSMENSGQPVIDVPSDKDDTITLQQGNAEYNQELKKLQDIVNPSGKITNFKIYPSDDNIIIEGTFLRNEAQDSGVKFTMALTAREVKIEMLGQNDLDNEVSEVLTKLKGYYGVWCNEWYKKLSEYKSTQK